MNPAVIDQLVSMRHSPLHNYIVPGLTSWLIMDNGNAGKMRLFECSREQQEFITPHSHRFDFSACVVRGQVENTLWVEGQGDQYMMTQNKYLGTPGLYDSRQIKVVRYISDHLTHAEGDWYDMKHTDIHSIKFSRGAFVLFFEGHAKTDQTYVLEPVVNNHYIPTMKVEDWMFQKGEQA